MPFLIIVSVIIIGLLIRGVFLSKKKRLALYNSFKTGFGKIKTKKYRFGRSHRNAVLKRFSADNVIDDITWNDLDMEAVFERIDSCKSAVGEEYLYFLLHSESIGKEGEEFDKLVSNLSGDERTRTDLLFSLNRLGYIKEYSPFDYLDNLTVHKGGIPVRHIIFDLLFIPLIALLFYRALWGGIGIFLLLVINILLYFKDKNALGGLFESLGFIVRLSRESLNLINSNIKLPSEYMAQISENTRFLKRLKNRGIYLAASGQGANGGSPVEIILTYLNMVFHFDLIEYDLMLKDLSGKKNLLENMLLLFGRLDSAISVADFRTSMGDNWCKPEFIDYVKGDETKVKLSIKDGIHPLVDNYVPSSIDAKRGILLTGSNASGKSTFLRMVAINSILAQTIYTVCAREYVSPVFNIFSSIALKDDLRSKESYFIVEINSLKRILDSDISEAPVLCFIDEVLRGTNTVERISASNAILRYFASENILAFAATHDGELADLLSDVMDNYHFGENVSDQDVSFDYKIKSGKADTRNAIRLLKSYGYPEAIVNESEKMAQILDAKG